MLSFQTRFASRFHKEGLDLAGFIENYQNKPFSKVFSWALSNGKCLVVLDGIDEIPDKQTMIDATRAVSGFVDSYGADGNRIILTCRSDSEAPRWLPKTISRFQICHLEDPEIREIIHVWLGGIGLGRF